MPRKYLFTRQINVFSYVYRAIATKDDLEGYKFLTEVHRFCYLIKIRLTSDYIWMLLLFCGDENTDETLFSRFGNVMHLNITVRFLNLSFASREN